MIKVFCAFLLLLISSLAPCGAADPAAVNVQALINAAPPGTVVTLPSGSFNVHILTPKSGVSLQGAGQEKTILTTTVLIPAALTGAAFSNLTLQGAGNYFVVARGPSRNLVFTNVTFEQGAGLPPFLRNISDAKFVKCVFNGWQSPTGAPSFDGDDNLVMEQCVFRHARGRLTFRFTRNILVEGCADTWNNQPPAGNKASMEVGGPDCSWTVGARFLEDNFTGVGPIDTIHNSGEAFLAQGYPAPPFKDYPQWPADCVVRNLLVKDCRFQNSHYPVELYDGGKDCKFLQNTLTDVPGINLRGDFTHGRNFPIANCEVRDNIIREPAGRYPGSVVVWQQGGGVNGETKVENNQGDHKAGGTTH